MLLKAILIIWKDIKFIKEFKETIVYHFFKKLFLKKQVILTLVCKLFVKVSWSPDLNRGINLAIFKLSGTLYQTLKINLKYILADNL